MSSAISENFSFTSLSDELLLKVFSYLMPSQVALCCRVNSTWRQLASDNMLWRERGRELFGQYLAVPNVHAFLGEFHSQQLRSNDEIVERIQAFANRVSLGQNGSFRCIIAGAGQGYRTISVEIKGGRTRAPRVSGAPQDREDNVREFDIQDTWHVSHAVGRSDLLNPEPEDPGIWYGSRQLPMRLNDLALKYENGPFSAVVRFTNPLQNEMDFHTWQHFTSLENATQMQQKVNTIIARKISSLSVRNHSEQGQRILVIASSATLLFSLVLRKYWK